jgi:hypothetical protein
VVAVATAFRRDGRRLAALARMDAQSVCLEKGAARVGVARALDRDRRDEQSSSDGLRG